MNFAKSMLAARASILQQGIQQTNRYVFKESNSDPEYPYSVVLPGYGYDLIDHSIWSIIRKIPFRKTYTELQVTFIVGSDNYSRYINKWQSAISKPVRSNGGVSSAANFAQLNGIGTGGFDADVALLTDETSNGAIDILGSGGAVNYMDKFYTNDVTISLLSESDNSTNALFIFHEAFISQIAPIQLTSVETGYSTFQVNYKFASVTAI